MGCGSMAQPINETLARLTRRDLAQRPSPDVLVKRELSSRSEPGKNHADENGLCGSHPSPNLSAPHVHSATVGGFVRVADGRSYLFLREAAARFKRQMCVDHFLTFSSPETALRGAFCTAEHTCGCLPTSGVDGVVDHRPCCERAVASWVDNSAYRRRLNVT
jgi:hypothetical protein